MSDEPNGNDIKPPEVPVSLGRLSTDAAKTSGLVKIDPESFRVLQDLGANLSGPGMINLQGGSALMSQLKLRQASEYLIEEMQELHKDKKAGSRISKMCDLARTLAVVSKGLTESQRLSLDVNGGVRPPGISLEIPPTGARSFAQGQTIKAGTGTLVLGREIHMHPPASEPSKG